MDIKQHKIRCFYEASEGKVNTVIDEVDLASEVTKSNTVENGTGKNIGSIKRIAIKKTSNDMNNEQEKVIEKLKKVLNFLEGVQIKNEECFANINKPLDDLLSSLKYLPTEPSFDIIPVEIKTDILSYLCDSGTFVAASVCQEWRDILKRRVKEMEEVNIGKCCSFSSDWVCEDSSRTHPCFMPEELLKASMVLRMDIPLSICFPVVNVDPELLAESLTSVSEFAITNGCCCREDDEDCDDDTPILTTEQTKQLLEALEKNTETVTTVYLEGLDMTHLDQHRLINCLLKIENLRLAQGQFPYDEFDAEPILSIETLIEKLLEDSAGTRLKHLNLEYIEYPEESSEDLADALCMVEEVDLGQYFPLTAQTSHRLIQNVLTRSVKTKSLILSPNLDWRHQISSNNLKILINKVESLKLWGCFTSEQVKVASGIPRVQVVVHSDENHIFKMVKITKGRVAM